MNLPENSSARRDATASGHSSAMTVGVEWLIDVAGCDEEILRDRETLGEVFRRIIGELNLQIIGEAHWHKFPMPGGGITGFALLTESHLACHTYPEHGAATINLYCCRARPAWAWEENLREMLGARRVIVRCIERGAMAEEEFEISDSKFEISNSQISNSKSEISNLKSSITSPSSEISNSKSEISNLKSEIIAPTSHDGGMTR